MSEQCINWRQVKYELLRSNVPEATAILQRVRDTGISRSEIIDAIAGFAVTTIDGEGSKAFEIIKDHVESGLIKISEPKSEQGVIRIGDPIGESNCNLCGSMLANCVDRCIHCGTNDPFGNHFAFRETTLSWYACFVPKGQFDNVVSQLRDDYEKRVRDFECTKSSILKANLWLILEMMRDLWPIVKTLVAWLGGAVGIGAVVSWINDRDE